MLHSTPQIQTDHPENGCAARQRSRFGKTFGFCEAYAAFQFPDCMVQSQFLLAQAADETNHLKRIFHEDLVRVNQQTAAFPVNAVALAPLIACSVAIGIAPGWEAENISVASHRKCKPPLNNDMLRQTADTIASGKMTGQPEPIEPLKDKEKKQREQDNTCPAKKMVQTGRGNAGIFLYKSRKSLKGIWEDRCEKIRDSCPDILYKAFKCGRKGHGKSPFLFIVTFCVHSPIFLMGKTIHAMSSLTFEGGKCKVENG